MSTDAVLAGIDATLEAWETQEDAARWHPDGDGPDDLAENQLAEWCLVYGVGGMRGMHATLLIYDAVTSFSEAASCTTAQMAQSYADFGESIAKATAEVFGFTWAAGDLHYHAEDAPRRVRLRCRVCHPEAYPHPLAIDGREYHRRQKARRR